MFRVPGTLGAKIRDLGLGGLGAHVCSSLPSCYSNNQLGPIIATPNPTHLSGIAPIPTG